MPTIICAVLYGLSDALRIYDEICQRSQRFIPTCLHHNIIIVVIRFVHVMVLNCARDASLGQYDFTVSDFLTEIFDVNDTVDSITVCPNVSVCARLNS